MKRETTPTTTQQEEEPVMTSLAVFPKLRRTLTDVMEDELYHVPNQQQQGFDITNSPTLMNPPQLHNFPKQNHQIHKIFKNNSAVNSEELLMIPEVEPLSKVPSHDMYYDVPEQLPEGFNDNVMKNNNIFNEFADPSLTTTNNIFRSEPTMQPHQMSLEHPQNSYNDQSSQPPTKLLKFNDDLTLDYFQNEEDENNASSKFVIYPGYVTSPNLIPEEIEDEEISEDEDDLEFDDLQPGNDTDLTNFGHLDDSMMLDNGNKGHYEMELDIDRMSLVDSDEDSFSSNSSMLEEDDESTPTFKTNKPKKQQFIVPAFPRYKKARQTSISTPKPTPTVTAPTTVPIDGEFGEDNQHQCHLLNGHGKPCLKQFSRPYDLIRHQETIHAERKKIFRCVVCNSLEGGLSKKTFSRGDALSRHVRVKHGLSGTEATDAIQYAKDHVEYL